MGVQMSDLCSTMPFRHLPTLDVQFQDQQQTSAVFNALQSISTGSKLERLVLSVDSHLQLWGRHPKRTM